MKSRDQSKGVPSTDLLVCFPSRSHHFLPKTLCSPSTHHLKRCNTRGIGPAASPLVCAKSSKRIEISEPTSPKVTCAGQIKVTRSHKQPKKSCKSWQSVMEEIEKLHNNNNKRNKKVVNFMQFLTCLKNNIKFDFHCFGSIPTTDHVITSDDDDEQEFQENDSDNEVSRTVFSKWFMVLQENQNTKYTKTEETESADNYVPPPNALLLMRCRSAPAKTWLQEEEEQEQEDVKSVLMEELESKKKKKSLVVMKYGSDLFKFSLSRSLSLKV